MTVRVVLPLLALAICIGCGTSKWTDTRRSATEQLLITDAMDRAVSRLDFRALAGKSVFLDDAPVKSLSDAQYLVSCLRQHMLASGCIVQQSREEAEYIMEVRAGAVGTDRHELLYGVPSVNIPALVPVSGIGIPSQIPEIPFVKKTDQRAVAKIAVFAYNRKTGRPIWQSGTVPVESDAKATWVFGAGPFQRGSIYDGMSFAGNKINIPLIDLEGKSDSRGAVSVADEAYFIEPGEASETQLAQKAKKTPQEPSPPPSKPKKQPAKPVVQATHTEKAAPRARATEGPGTKEKSKKSDGGKGSSTKAKAPAAPGRTVSPPSPASPGTEPAVPVNSVPGLLPPVGDRNPGQPTSLAHPAGLFAPDRRATTIR